MILNERMKNKVSFGLLSFKGFHWWAHHLHHHITHHNLEVLGVSQVDSLLTSALSQLMPHLLWALAAAIRQVCKILKLKIQNIHLDILVINNSISEIDFLAAESDMEQESGDTKKTVSPDSNQ